MSQNLTKEVVERSFKLLAALLELKQSEPVRLVICAAADQRDDTHIADLRALKPTDEELRAAARWAMTHDVSEGFRWVLQELLKDMGHESVANNI